MSTLTTEQDQAIADQIASQPSIPVGIGTKEAACTVAAINLALTGQLTYRIPPCMSLVVGKFVIALQDAMPAALRNSAEYRALIPGLAGTGRAHEQERLALILDWMWGTVLPTVQPLADARGFGDAWRTMTTVRTPSAAAAAATAAGSEAAWAAARAAAWAAGAAKAAKAAAWAALAAAALAAAAAASAA